MLDTLTLATDDAHYATLYGIESAWQAVLPAVLVAFGVVALGVVTAAAAMVVSRENEDTAKGRKAGRVAVACITGALGAAVVMLALGVWSFAEGNQRADEVVVAFEDAHPKLSLTAADRDCLEAVAKGATSCDSSRIVDGQTVALRFVVAGDQIGALNVEATSVSADADLFTAPN